VHISKKSFPRYYLGVLCTPARVEQYIDDMIIHANQFDDELLLNIRAFFDRFCKFNLKLSKCHFGATQ